MNLSQTDIHALLDYFRRDTQLDTLPHNVQQVFDNLQRAEREMSYQADFSDFSPSSSSSHLSNSDTVVHDDTNTRLVSLEQFLTERFAISAKPRRLVSHLNLLSALYS